MKKKCNLSADFSTETWKSPKAWNDNNVFQILKDCPAKLKGKEKLSMIKNKLKEFMLHRRYLKEPFILTAEKNHR